MATKSGYSRAVSYTVKKYVNGILSNEVTYDFTTYYSSEIPAITHEALMSMDENSYNARVIAIKNFIKENNHI